MKPPRIYSLPLPIWIPYIIVYGILRAAGNNKAADQLGQYVGWLWILLAVLINIGVIAWMASTGR